MLASERLNSTRTQWSRISDMHSPRAEFNPCSFESMIYLCGGFCKGTEKYDPLTDQFTLVTFAYPYGFIRSTCVVAESDCLAIIFESAVWRVNWSTKLLSVYSDNYRREVWSCTPPLIKQGVLYLVNIDFEPKCSEVSLTKLILSGTLHIP